MRKKFDLAVKVGTYEKNGETKPRYKNVGVVMEGDKGPFILLDKTFNPAGVPSDKETILIAMFEPKQAATNNDEIPF